MLSDDDREALRDSVDSLPPDDGPPWLFETVEVIVARHVAAVLNEAADLRRHLADMERQRNEARDELGRRTLRART